MYQIAKNQIREASMELEHQAYRHLQAAERLTGVAAGLNRMSEYESTIDELRMMIRRIEDEQESYLQLAEGLMRIANVYDNAERRSIDHAEGCSYHSGAIRLIPISPGELENMTRILL